MSEISTLLEAHKLWRAEGGSMPTGTATINPRAPYQSVPSGALHEFFYQQQDRFSLPPLTIPTRIAIERIRQMTRDSPLSSRPCIVWIGKRSWINPHALATLIESVAQDLPELFRKTFYERCFFIDPHNSSEYEWALVSSLQSPSAAAVISDLSDYNFSFSRKLSLIARSYNSTAIISRSSNDIHTPSAATTRWLISPSKGSSKQPHWRIQLLRWTGAAPRCRDWEVNNDNRETISFDLPTTTGN